MLISFQVVSDAKATESAEITVQVSHIESIADGRVGKVEGVTHVAMRSGRAFFVKHTYPEVKQMLETAGW